MSAAKSLCHVGAILILICQSLATSPSYGEPVCRVGIRDRIVCGHPYISHTDCIAIKGCCFDFKNYDQFPQSQSQSQSQSQFKHIPSCYYGNQCVGCTYTNGIGYNPNPFDCTSFYQCVEGRPDRTVLQHCPKGLHWSQNKLSCTYPGQAGCIQQLTPLTLSTPVPDPWTPVPTPVDCRARPGSGPYPHELFCDVFVNCVGSTRQEQCCPLPLVWDSRFKSCVYAGSQHAVCRRRCSNSTPRQCNGEDVVGCFPFTSSFGDRSKNKFYTQVTETTLARGAAFFNGRTSKIEVPGFRNIFNGKYIRDFSIALEFSFIRGSYGRRGLVYKGDCNNEATFGIILNGSGNKASIEAFVNHRDNKVVHSFVYPYTTIRVGLKYNGRTISLSVNGRVTSAKAVKGSLTSNHASLFLGFAQCSGYSGSLYGYINQVVIRAASGGTKFQVLKTGTKD